MTSVDTNLLLFAYAASSPHHHAAAGFLRGLARRSDVVISEFVLAELYLLLRNPAVLSRPLSGADAVAILAHYRKHPRWQLVGFPPDSSRIHGALWEIASQPAFARRRIMDARTALTLRSFGVTEFATANVADFQDLGFARVWNPLDG